ncbi:MAG TPA: dihydropteroate synthase [Candidatus Saccharimonadales bacterium]|nr:dihydropteroate synthase [Candidatus Saccharimonadales bacterium]
MTQLVGILNITPDSFSDGGQFVDVEKAIGHAEKLIDDGASLVDIGAESTRPKATPLTPEEEWERLEPVLRELLEIYPDQISVDTYHPETARHALALGDVIINDVTGMNNPAMREVVAEHYARLIISHLHGRDPQAAHEGKLIASKQQVIDELMASVAKLEALGLGKQQIILDPGIGFGKTPAVNEELLAFAADVPDYPVMIGYSRKRFLGDDRMELGPNLAAGKIAIASGAAYLRVHDVAGHQSLLD